MANDFFEEIVITWLQTNDYFIVSNIKYGHGNEIDILAVKNTFNKVIHIEVSCSSNPITILGTHSVKNNNDYKECAKAYLDKKYFSKDADKKIHEIVGKVIPIERWFVHAKLKEPKQLNVFKAKSVKTIDVVNILKDIRNSNLNMVAGNKRIKQLLDVLD